LPAKEPLFLESSQLDCLIRLTNTQSSFTEILNEQPQPVFFGFGL